MKFSLSQIGNSYTITGYIKIIICVFFLLLIFPLQFLTYAQNSDQDQCNACNNIYQGYQLYSDQMMSALNQLKIPQVTKNKTMSFLAQEKEQIRSQLSEIIIFEGDYGVGDLGKLLQKGVPQQAIEQYQQINKLIGQRQLDIMLKGNLNQKISIEDYKLINEIIGSTIIIENGVSTPLYIYTDTSIIAKKDSIYISDTITYKQLFRILRSINQAIGDVIKENTSNEIRNEGMTYSIRINPNFVANEKKFYDCFRKSKGSVCRGGERVKFQFKERRDSNLGGFKRFSTSIQGSIDRLKSAYSKDSLNSIFSMKNRISGNIFGFQLGGSVQNNNLGEEWTNRKNNIYQQSVVSYQAIKQRNAILAEPFEKKGCNYAVTLDYNKKNSIYESVATSDKILLQAIADQMNDGACLYKDVIQDSMAGDISELTTQGPVIMTQLDELGKKADILNKGVQNYLQNQSKK